MFDARHVRLRTQVHIAGLLGLWQFGVKRAPLGAALATLEAEAQLHALTPIVARATVDGHVAGVHFLVAQLGGAGVHHLEVVVAGQPWDAVGACHAHLVFSAAVVGLKLLQSHWPIHQVGTLDITVGGAHLELVLLEAQRCASPVRRGTAHGLANPGGQSGEVFRDAPSARCGSRVQPSQLAE